MRERPAETTLEQQIKNLHREPFRDVLADMIGCAPGKKELRAFARKSPDRFWQSIAICAKLAGYSDPKLALNVENNFYIQLQNMSDAEVEALAEQAILKLSKKEAIDAT